MEKKPRYSLQTLRAMRTGGSVLSHNKARVRVTMEYLNATLTGELVGIGSTLDVRHADGTLTQYVEPEWIVHAEVEW